MAGRSYRERAKKVRDVEIIIQNLLYHKLRRPVAISLNRNHYKPNIYRRAGYYTTEAVDRLYQHGFIEREMGYGDETGIHAQRTKIWPTKKLLTMFATVPREEFIFTPIDQVILKDTDKHIIDYTDPPQHIRRVRRKLRQINSVTDASLVQYIDPDSKQGYRLRTRLRAIYNNGTWTEGGRLYTVDLTRDGYQYLSENDRQYIHIDSIPTVELDFAGMQPRILYAWQGI